MSRDRDSKELLAVAPLVAGTPPVFVGTAMLVANGTKVIAVTSAEVLRPHQGKPLAILTKLDGSANVPIAGWGMGRYSGLGLIELGGNVAPDHDVVPLPIGKVCATSDTRGAPAALVAVVALKHGYDRVLVAVHVDNDDGGGMSDAVSRLASPIDPAHATVHVDGLPLFAWFPPDPLLGRPSEVLAMALGYPYRAKTAQPRSTPVIAELIGLDDLGRALISAPEPDQRSELKLIVGEIVDRTK